MPETPCIEWSDLLRRARGIDDPLPCAMVLAENLRRNFAIGESLVHRGSGFNVFTGSAALLGLLAAVGSSPAGDGPWRISDVQRADIDRLVRAAGGIVAAPLVAADPRAPEHRDEVHAELFADVSCQLSVQARPSDAWCVAQYCLGWSADDRRYVESPPIQAASEAAYGAPHSIVGLILGGIVAHATSSEALLSVPRSAETIADRGIADALDCVARRISLPLPEVGRAVAEELSKIGGLASRVVAFWQRYPLVDLGEGRYLSAPPPLVTSTLGYSQIFKLEAAARVLEGRSDTAVTRFIAARFEAFLRLVLDELGDRGDVLPAQRFRNDRCDESIDFVVVDRGEPVVTLLEAKKRFLTADTFFARDHGAVYRDVAQMGAPILQCARFLASLLDASHSGRLTDAGSRVLSALRRARHVVLAVVVPSLPARPEGAHFRSRVEQSIRDSLAMDPTAARAWGVLCDRLRVHWVVLDASDVLGLVGRRCNLRFGDTLRRYASGVTGPTFTGRGLVPSVLDYARALRPDAETITPSSALRVISTLLEEACSRLFGRPFRDFTG